LLVDRAHSWSLQDKPGATLARSHRGAEADEVFARGTLAEEVYGLDGVSGKRTAISPAGLCAT